MKPETNLKSINDAVAEFIEKHPDATSRDAHAYARDEYRDEELTVAFVRAWVDRTSASAEFLSKVDRLWPDDKYD